MSSNEPDNQKSIGQLFSDGVWNNNPGLVQLLGLCPLLAVSTSLAYGIGLGIATLVVLVCSGFLVSLSRHLTESYIRIPVYVLIIAGLVTGVDMLMQAHFFNLHRVLGLFVPLIVTNCAIIARAEAVASRSPVLHAVVDGFGNGLGFLLALCAVGALRELLGGGTVFANMDSLFGPVAKAWEIQLHPGLLVFILPPGAFLVLGFLIAGFNAIKMRTAVTMETPSSVTSRTVS